MARVTGIGGIFFKANNAEALRAWYAEHLGLVLDEQGGAIFHWRDQEQHDVDGYTVWAAFKKDTRYFDPSSAPFMINYRVDDLDGMIKNLKARGVQVDDRVEEYEYGRFAWLTDPEGNRAELWEPPKPKR